MERVVLILLVACAKHAEAPPSPLQDGAPAAAVADAAAVTIDASVASEAPTATKLVAGVHATCAVMSDASVRCWGGNTDGELGDGTTKSSSTPVKPNARGVKDLVLGDDFACALIDDSSVVCWGRIGFGKDHRSLVPRAVPGVRDVVRIFAVGAAACATDRGGALVCWGDVDPRGHVTTSGASHAPTPVPNVDHAIALTAHAAVRENGEVVTWTDGGTPKPTGVKSAKELAERDVPCALDAGGAVTCFADKPLCADKSGGRPTRAGGDAKVDDKSGGRPTRAGGDAKVDDKSGGRPTRSSAGGDAKVDDKSGGRPTRSSAGGDAKVDDKSGGRPTRSSAGGDAKVDDKSGGRPTRSSAGGDAKVDDKSQKPAKPKKKPKPKNGKKAEPPPAPVSTGFALPIGKAAHLAFATGTCVASAAKRLDCIDLDHACKVVRPWPALVSIEETSGACARLSNGTVRCGVAGTQAAPLIAGVRNAVSISATATGGCALTKDRAVLCWEGTASATAISF